MNAAASASVTIASPGAFSACHNTVRWLTPFAKQRESTYDLIAVAAIAGDQRSRPNAAALTAAWVLFDAPSLATTLLI
jgi:hypothetical protein